MFVSLIQENMHNHRDLKLMPQIVTCQESPSNTGWHPYAARAHQMLSILQPLPHLQPHVGTCFVSCGPLNLWFMLYSPFPSWTFMMALYRFGNLLNVVSSSISKICLKPLSIETPGIPSSIQWNKTWGVGESRWYSELETELEF